MTLLLLLLLLLSVQYIVVGCLRDPGAWAPTDERDLLEPVALGASRKKSAVYGQEWSAPSMGPGTTTSEGSRLHLSNRLELRFPLICILNTRGCSNLKSVGVPTQNLSLVSQASLVSQELFRCLKPGMCGCGNLEFICTSLLSSLSS